MVMTINHLHVFTLYRCHQWLSLVWIFVDFIRMPNTAAVSCVSVWRRTQRSKSKTVWTLLSSFETTLSGFETPLFQQIYNFPINNSLKKMWENLTCSSFEGELYNAVPPTNITMDFKRWGVRHGSLSYFVSCDPNVHLSLISPTSNSFLSIE